MSEYLVEGYGAAARNPNYDGPYLDGYDFDPGINFMYAGDPEKQAELQKVIEDNEGVPVLENGTVKILTPEGQDNIVILPKEPESVQTVVLPQSRVDEINEETAKQDLLSVQGNPEGAGAPSGTTDTEQDSLYKENPEGDTHEDINFDGESGADEQREGRPYNPTQEVRLSSEDPESEQENPSADQKVQAVTNDPSSSTGNVKLS